MTLCIIDASTVRELLPMDDCINVLAPAMKAASAGQVRVPQRTFMPLPGDAGSFLTMPGAASDPLVFGAKILSLFPGNAAALRPVIQGFVTLFDPDDGTPLAIIEGASLTAIRTAAASGLATRALARVNAHSHGIFGAGVQADTHADAICAVRRIHRVVVWARSFPKAQALAEQLQLRLSIDVIATQDPAQAAACDIVSTVTASHEPVLHQRWIQPGTHINLVGAHAADTREADSELMAAASVFTDLRASALAESGDILIPLREGRFDDTHIRAEIGEVLAGIKPGRNNADEVTVYKSLGITAQDLAAAALVYQRAQETGAGVRVSL